ncbi:MAG: MFS transporter [Bacteroidota bacterium]
MLSTAFRFATIVALGGFVFGLDAALISGTVKYVSAEFGLSDLEIGTVVSAPGFGVLFALPVASILADKYGRRGTLQLIAAVYLVSATCSAITPNFMALVAARFIGGLAFTSLSLSAMYIGEIAPSNMRGKLVAMNQINIVVGLSAAYFINYFIQQGVSNNAAWAVEWGIIDSPWRWMLGTEILPALLWLGLLFTIPRSPRWLVLKNRLAEAKQVLSQLLPANEVEAEIALIQSSLATEKETPSLQNQLKTLFSPAIRKAFWIGLTFAIVQQITGINAILFYAPTVFEQIGVGTDAAFSQAVFVGLISVVFTVLALLFIDKIGRRPMTVWGLLWAVLSLLLCSYGFHRSTYTLTADALANMGDVMDTSQLLTLVGIEYGSDTAFKTALEQTLGAAAKTHESALLQAAGNIPSTLILFGILSFIAAFQFSVGPIMWVIFSEVFSTKVRGVAIPVFAFVTSVVSYLVQQFFPWQLSNMGARDIFLFYAVCSGIGLIILGRLLPETKGKTIEEIEVELQQSAA